MTNIRQHNVPKADLAMGEFNNCEHTFMQVEAGKYQTVSCRLPNGKFVTFAFCPGQGDEMECVDIHSTCGEPFKYKSGDSDIHYKQQAIGFSRNGDTFDTRKANKPTGLMTVLLNKSHHLTEHEKAIARTADSALSAPVSHIPGK